jgi:CheY-like chemotaxis protein/predicted  nucleic acid-binding Zn-ribbon protein
MSRKILLIESDGPFAEEVTSALEARGLEVRTTGDGREGYELAREWGPDAIVLCVELPGMSGYVICQKLKKDEALKSIPLVITSAEATPETFEKHRTLKVRAEDYLLKPFSPTALLASLGALIELPDSSGEEPLPQDDEPTGDEEEELVALEEEAGIEPLGGEPLDGSDLPALDLGSLPDDGPAGTPAPGLEDDLNLLDEAFEGLSVSPEPRRRPAVSAAPRTAPVSAFDLEDEGPVAPEDVDAAAASLPEEDDAAARAALGGLDMVADDALGALGGSEPSSEADLERDLLGGLGPDLGLGSAEEEPELPPSRPTVRAPSADALRAAGIKVVGEKPTASAAGADTGRLERELTRKDGRIRDLEDRLRELEDRLSDTERRADEGDQRVEAAEKRASEASSRLAAAESQATASKSRLDAALAQSRRLEADVKAAREEGNRARRRAEEAQASLDDERRRADEAESRVAAAGEAQEKIEALEREVDELKTELVVSRGEAEGARSEVEKRTAELRKRVQELEAQASKNEERVVKAYLKIKNDEKVREKTKKALAIASQLLDEGAPPEPEKPRTSAAAAAAAALGREQ